MTLRVGLFALVGLLAIVGIALTGSGVVALPADASTGDTGASNATTMDETEETTTMEETIAAGQATETARLELSGGIAQPEYTGIAGDPVDISFSASGEDTYLLIGGNRLTDSGKSVGFVDVLKSDSGEPINTRTLGTEESNVESCGDPDVSCDIELLDEDGEIIAESLGNFPGATGAGGLARPIVPQRYRLAISNGTFIEQDSGHITPAETVERSELLLEKPTFHDEIEVFTTADPDDYDDIDGDGAESLGALESNGLDRSVVTEGDRVVLGFEASGIWGALSHFAEERDAGPVQSGEEIDHAVLSDLLDVDEGVSLRVRQTNPGQNERRSEVDLTDANADGISLVLADATEVETGDSGSTAGRFYLVLETGPDGPFTETPEPGDEFAVEFALEGAEGERYRFDTDGNGTPPAFDPVSADDNGVPEQFPYWESSDSRVSADTSFTIQERFLRYDHVTNDGDVLVEAGEGTLTGTTSILPVTELSADFVDDTGEPIRTLSPLEIDDGEFSIAGGFDGASPGTQLNYELYDGSSLKDARNVVVVDDTDDPDRLTIVDAPANVTVAEDGNLSALEVDVRNAGGLEGDGTLTLDVDDGNVTGTHDLTVAPNESIRVGFSSVSTHLGPGEYPFTLALHDDERNGTLIVEEDPAKTTISADSEEGDGDSDSSEEGDGDSDDSENDESAEDAEGDGDSDSSEGDESTEDAEEDDGAGDTDDASADEEDAPPDDTPATLLPFGIGTREAFGGTVLVGATYLLGHWV
ncbi:hypothetical protein J2751_001220 [Halorubrum alkaliphilum]|uniref:Uncharacterized protein n=1 Tax=Halorubrum alkaliphilum TaxID=261290 RepID=A0A8T4GCM6_9EURY|nr:BGTF surface domain-containing protein [Halorubrum alkaliphilum]MBP1922214.1 hypothetical protein [Halorubrum alkaliphilum]